MSIWKRKLDSGAVRWQFTYRDLSGKRRAKQFRTQTAAKDFRTKVDSEIKKGTHTPDSTSVTLERACELWLQRARREQLELGTVKGYEEHIRLHILPLLGAATKLSRLTSTIVETFRDKLIETRSRNLAKVVLVSLKGVLKECMRLRLVGQNVAQQTQVRQTPRDQEQVVIPTKAEIRAILHKAAELWPGPEPQWQRPLIVTAVFTGLRLSELRGLTWEHVDFDAKVIRVRQRTDLFNKMGPPKSRAGKRDVPLAPMNLNILKEWKLACPSSPLNLVFPTKAGGVIAGSNVYRLCWQPLLRELGLLEKGYTFHCLRHVCASLLIEEDWNAKKIMTVMGHASVQMTYDRYGHLFPSPEDDARTMERVQARLLGENPLQNSG